MTFTFTHKQWRYLFAFQQPCLKKIYNSDFDFDTCFFLHPNVLLAHLCSRHGLLLALVVSLMVSKHKLYLTQNKTISYVSAAALIYTVYTTYCSI